MKRLIQMLKKVLDDNIGYVVTKVIITLFRPIDFSRKLHTTKPGWPITYIEGSRVIIIISNILYFFFEGLFCLSKQCRP